jgi:hypothetical protein
MIDNPIPYGDEGGSISSDAPSPTQEHTTPAAILTAAADLIEPEGCWTQGTSYRDGQGRAVDGCDPSVVVSRCMNGAIGTVSGLDFRLTGPAYSILEGVVGRDTAFWNDEPGRTQAEVVAALRKAAALAAAEQGSRKDGSSQKSISEAI